MTGPVPFSSQLLNPLPLNPSHTLGEIPGGEQDAQGIMSLLPSPSQPHTVHTPLPHSLPGHHHHDTVASSRKSLWQRAHHIAQAT